MFEGMTTVEIIKLMAPLLILEAIMIIFSLYRLVKDRVKYLPKWAWAFVIVVFNFVVIGPLVFLMIGRERD